MASIGTDDFFATISELNARSRLGNSPPRIWRAPSPSGSSSSARAITPWPCRCTRKPCAARRVSTRISSAQRYRGPLQGIPYGVKDLLAYAGQPTTWGAKPYAGQVFDYNATVIDKLAGAGRHSHRQTRHGGTRRRRRLPFRLRLAHRSRSRIRGTAPAGPAAPPADRRAAVAAGLVPFAIGSETSGSIVTPASFCGVTALRPTYGLVSRHGAMALSWTLDKLGPFAHYRRRLRRHPASHRRRRFQGPGLRRQELLLHAPIRTPA